MTSKKEYFAFISYKREDEKWAKWLQRKLEHYKLPTAVRKDNPSLPTTVYPIFRDTTDLSGGVLEKAINDALDLSRYLIVICSPHAVQSPWVCKEVQHFIDSGREEYIIPFIVDGLPYSKDIINECFPENLRNLLGSKELLGINLNEMGQDAAAIKVVACMFELQFDTLWRRYEKAKYQRIWMWITFALIVAFVSSIVGGYMIRQNILIEKAYQKIKEKNWKMLENQSKAVAGKAMKLIEKKPKIPVFDSYNEDLVQRLAIEILPKDLSNPIDRPYTVEAEAVLREAIPNDSAIFIRYIADVKFTCFSADGKYIISVANNNSIKLWDVNNGVCIKTFNGYAGCIESASFSPDGKYIVSASIGVINLWDVNSGVCIKTFTRPEYFKFASFSPDGKYIVSVSTLYVGRLYLHTRTLWDINNGVCINKFKKITSSDICFVTYSPDGKCMALPDNYEIKLYDKDDKGYEEGGITFIGHKNIVQSISFSPNGKYIVSASRDGTIKVWDVKSGICIKTIAGHNETVCCVSFSSDGHFILSASDDGIIKIWGFKPLQELINETREYFRHQPLTDKERKQYYLD